MDANPAVVRAGRGEAEEPHTKTRSHEAECRSLGEHRHPVHDHFCHDTVSRVNSVSYGSYSAGYTYLASSRLMSQIALKQNTTSRMVVNRQFDYLDRLLQVSSVPQGANQLPWVHGYGLNAANQRTRLTLADSSYWVYQYDSLGQVTSGKRYWSDGTPDWAQWAGLNFSLRATTMFEQDCQASLEHPGQTVIKDGDNQIVIPSGPSSLDPVFVLP